MTTQLQKEELREILRTDYGISDDEKDIYRYADTFINFFEILSEINNTENYEHENIRGKNR